MRALSTASLTALFLVGCSPTALQPPPAQQPPGAPVPQPQMQETHPAVAFAQAQEGRPYCWGGAGPDCFDCSGLTHMAWHAAGRDIPRTSDDQHEQLRRIHWAFVLPGDVVWRPGHVGLYVGNGWAIHAPGDGKTVRYQRVDKYRLALRVY